MQSRLVIIKEQLAAINLSLQGKQQQLTSPDEISQMLETIVIQNRELQLVTLSNLPVEALIASPAEEIANIPEELDQTNIQPQVNSERLGQLFKHSVEITIQGEYSNLLAYLDELEKIPSRMYWDQVTLSVDDYPSTTLTLTVYTLSLDETWLKI
jgi:MSHA biogenesis protein MshJ